MAPPRPPPDAPDPGRVPDQDPAASADAADDDGLAPRPRGIGGFFSAAREGYDELVNAIVRPPRAHYSLAELGPAGFEYGGCDFVREDFQITNPRELRLECSFWRRRDMPAGGVPCVVYMHGNASCRAEALQVLAPVFAVGASVASFDFAGCGLSQGDYISLGMHEKDDLAAVLEHLRATGMVTAIALWGRSMGAASAVLHASRDPSLAGLVLDSPFASLEQVALELVSSAPETVPGAPNVPPFLVKTALRLVAGSVKSRANFDLYKLRPVDAARTCFVPALFGCGNDDKLVRPHHSQMIYDGYAGDKNVVRFEGDHNDMRPGFFLDSASIFLKQVLLLPEDGYGIDAPLDRDSRPLSILNIFFSGYRRGGGHSAGGGGGVALAQQEEAMLMQAIMASLEANGGTSPPAAVIEAARATEGGADGGDGGPDRAPVAAAAGLDEEEADDQLLREAIRQSLETAAATGPPTAAPAAHTS